MEENDLILFNEARLPVTQADITKPTKEFVINLITIFFNTFQIDGSAIKQVRTPTNHCFVFEFLIYFCHKGPIFIYFLLFSIFIFLFLLLFKNSKKVMTYLYINI